MSRKEYLIRYIRHAQAESNCPDSSGEDIMDPKLTTRALEEDWVKTKIPGATKTKVIGMGRDLASGTMANKFESYAAEGKFGSYFIVSPLTRALQTFLISVPYKTLMTAKIVLEPLLTEQTIWFSDRARRRTHIEAVFKTELECRTPPKGLHKLEFRDLDINWGAIDERQDREWQLKDGDWAPAKLIQRGLDATKAIIKHCRAAKADSGYKPYSVCVYGHGGFVNYMVEELGPLDFSNENMVLSAWEKGEDRVYSVVDDDDNVQPKGNLFKRKEIEDATLSPNVDLRDENAKRQKLHKIVVSKKYGRKANDETKELYARAERERKNPNEVVGNTIEYLTG
ncbi:hypothetical protein JX265_011749 [Neoarthrinium moseri]|uniref:Phosphoglycerate mutase family protein n=1 Tax=Neoarthrinium moseri TaxID=1658444 RepID=A0A9P9WBG1_9PEZI|nr:hypothetical protein JX265_011749 [Neoarthrinium moseri]